MNDLMRILLALLAGGATLLIFQSAETVQLTRVQYGIVGAVVVTAAIHLLAGPDEPWLFLNGIGFLGLLLARYFLPIPQLHRLAAWGLVSYTLLTIVLYFVVHPWGIVNGRIDTLGLFTKAVEAAIIGLLLLEQLQTQRKIDDPI